MEFNYPIDYSLYTTEEITIIIKFLDTIEECYLRGVELEEYKKVYKDFKSIVRAKSEENSLYRDFKEISMVPMSASIRTRCRNSLRSCRRSCES